MGDGAGFGVDVEGEGRCGAMAFRPGDGMGGVSEGGEEVHGLVSC
jgi:hypothetical protein